MESIKYCVVCGNVSAGTPPNCPDLPLCQFHKNRIDDAATYATRNGYWTDEQVEEWTRRFVASAIVTGLH